MKKITTFFITLFLLTTLVNAEENFFDYSAKLVNGQELKFSEYSGKVILLANTASNCGFTPQYEGLQEIFLKYKDQGLVVLAFPSNDFGGQEPGSNEEIGLFCEQKYQVTFPVFEKSIVKGGEKSMLFKFLTEQSSEDLTGEIKWNFEKFLIDKNGQLVERYGSFTKPTSSKIAKKIEELLAQ